MKGTFVCIILWLLYLLAPAQDNYYWVKFKDKSNNAYTLSNPLQFLSQASLNRREKQHIALDSTDLPITQAYINGLTPHISYLKHRIKWFNLVVVRIDDSTQVDAIKQLWFVDSVNAISVNPPKALHVQNKLETNFVPIDQYISDGSNPYGPAYRQINMLHADKLHQMGYTGSGMVIATMDNGWPGVNLLPAFDHMRSHILGTWDFTGDSANVYYDGGHGTNTLSCMAGDIPGKFLGTAPDASYYLLHTEDNYHEWMMEEFNWAAAAEYADSAGASVFSTSLGYTEFDDDIGSHTYADLDGHTTFITRAGNMAFSKGILVLNSAGNEGAHPWHYISAPADGDSIIAVGAVDSAGNVTPFSGRGPAYGGNRIKPDVCSQGAQSAVINTAGYTGYSGGTSFSCPIMAGCAACLWQAFPDKSAKEIYSAIIESGSYFENPNNDIGYGIPDFYNAYVLLKADTATNKNIVRTDNGISVFPNPFTNELNVSTYSDSISRTLKVELFDVAGHKMVSQQVAVYPKTFSVFSIVEASNLAAGKYILRLDGDKNKSYVLIKQ